MKNKIVFGVLLVGLSALILYLTMPNRSLEAVESTSRDRDETTTKLVEETTRKDSMDKDLILEGKTTENQVVVEEDDEVPSDNKTDVESVSSEPQASSSGVDIVSNLEALNTKHSHEKRDASWAGYWESELNTIVLISGSQSPVKDTKVDCKSTVCEVSVSFVEVGGSSAARALGSLSKEFSEREMKFAPSSINPKTGEIVFYTKPGSIN